MRTAVVVVVLLSAFAFAQSNPVPFINQPTKPDAAAPGTPTSNLTVRGTGFVNGAVVLWNGQGRSTTFVSSSQLVAQILSTDFSVATTATVTVSNPAPGGGLSNAVFFTVHGPAAFVLVQGPVTNTTGNKPVQPASADLNADGKLDVVVSNSASSNISVLLGNGDGTFQPAVTYATASQPGEIAIQDFNHDGILDLAVVTKGRVVSVLLGQGGGTFQAHVDFATGKDSSGVIAADFNKDGNVDLAVSNQNCTNGQPPCGNGQVAILLGNGDGTFKPEILAATSKGANHVATGDFNGDGNLDLAVAAGNGGTGKTISILIGNGDGTFLRTTDYTTGANPVNLDIADFSADGKLDIAVVNSTAGSVTILTGNGDGTFTVGNQYRSGGMSPNFDFAALDVNADNAVDLVVTNTATNGLSPFPGNGDGTFRRLDPPFPAGPQPSGVAAGDFNGDGKMDFAVADAGNNQVSIILQQP